VHGAAGVTVVPTVALSDSVNCHPLSLAAENVLLLTPTTAS